jgi:hypothetical protein
VYRISSAIITDVVDLMPKFGVIKQILVYKDVVYFYYDETVTVCFNQHYHAYEITLNHCEVNCIKHSDLIDYHPLTVSHLNSLKLVTLKYHVNK